MNCRLSKSKVDSQLNTDNSIYLSNLTKLVKLEGSQVEQCHIIAGPSNNFEDLIQKEYFNLKLEI